MDLPPPDSKLDWRHNFFRRRRDQPTNDDGPSASYSRFSSGTQREESIPDQQRQCRDFAAQLNDAISAELEYSDAAVSGTKLHREGLDAMLQAAKEGKFKRLYFYNLSRLARESVISMPLLKQLVYVHKVRVFSVTEGIDSARDGWEIVASIFSIIHERYIKDLGANVFRGQEGAILAGFSAGDHCFGYSSVPVPGTERRRRGRDGEPRMTYVIDEQTSAWVIRVFHWFVVERRSLRWIARELNERGAPKDHRATTKHWHHQLLPELLRREKYIGVWPWGKNKNVRNPMTGEVSQEERPEEEWQKWTRKFPELQLVSDEMFAAAGALLDENDRKNELHRRPNGKLAGSRTGNSKTHPRHLLSGLLRCKCTATLNVSGANGKYLRCPNWAKGVCTSKTQLRRDLAERLILEVIGQKILSNPAWHAAVLQHTITAWKTREECRGDVDNLKRQLAEIDRKISHLVDSVESGNDTGELRQRLGERRHEREVLHKQLAELQQATTRPPEEPTADWVAAKIKNLHEVLHGGGPAAALALRKLVGGVIDIEEIREPDRKRFYLRARFLLDSMQTVRALEDPLPGPAGADNGTKEEIVIDFRELDPREQIADQVKELWDQGLTDKEIAKRVGWNRNIVSQARDLWFRQRGLEPPDGRSCRKRLARPTKPELLADQAMVLWNEDLLIQDIARRLDRDRDTVKKAIDFWHESRGLKTPDGRTRRKKLPRKISPQDPPAQEGPQQ